jgi:hypothetical protein
MKTTSQPTIRFHLFFLVSCLLLGAGTAAAGPAIDILIEPGDSAQLTPKQFEQRLDLKKYMTRTLPVKLGRHGIEGRIIGDQDDYAGEGRQLLIVRYERYNPGATAARIIVGFGAGAASLDVSCELLDGDRQLLAWEDGCGTSEHWQRLVNKLNDNTVLKLKAHYGLR